MKLTSRVVKRLSRGEPGAGTSWAWATLDPKLAMMSAATKRCTPACPSTPATRACPRPARSPGAAAFGSAGTADRRL